MQKCFVEGIKEADLRQLRTGFPLPHPDETVNFTYWVGNSLEDFRNWIIASVGWNVGATPSGVEL